MRHLNQSLHVTLSKPRSQPSIKLNEARREKMVHMTSNPLAAGHAEDPERSLARVPNAASPSVLPTEQQAERANTPVLESSSPAQPHGAAACKAMLAGEAGRASQL